MNNGAAPDPAHPFAFAAADLTYLTANVTNCRIGNTFDTLFELLAPLLPCP